MYYFNNYWYGIEMEHIDKLSLQQTLLSNILTYPYSYCLMNMARHNRTDSWVMTNESHDKHQLAQNNEGHQLNIKNVCGFVNLFFQKSGRCDSDAVEVYL